MSQKSELAFYKFSNISRLFKVISITKPQTYPKETESSYTPEPEKKIERYQLRVSTVYSTVDPKGSRVDPKGSRVDTILDWIICRYAEVDR